MGTSAVLRGALGAADPGLQETLDIGRAHLGLAGGDVVELPLLHPLLELADQVEEVVERVDDEEEGLVVIDLEVLVDHPLELDRIALDQGALDAVLALAEGAQEAAAVDLDPLPGGILHQAELDGEPEEAGQRLLDTDDAPDPLLLI